LTLGGEASAPDCWCLRGYPEIPAAGGVPRRRPQRSLGKRQSWPRGFLQRRPVRNSSAPCSTHRRSPSGAWSSNGNAQFDPAALCIALAPASIPVSLPSVWILSLMPGTYGRENPQPFGPSTSTTRRGRQVGAFDGFGRPSSSILGPCRGGDRGEVPRWKIIHCPVFSFQ